MATPFTAWLMLAAPRGSSVGGAPSRVTCAMEPCERNSGAVRVLGQREALRRTWRRGARAEAREGARAPP